ncbi:MAG: hypothetical protein KKC20_24755 [Proteobacteria bacterium]|nr:hypothetical protein [Pseudomonadota bacterium]
MDECNVMDLQYNADGSINRDAVWSFMRELSKVEHQWLADQGITIEGVGVFSHGGVKGTEGLPYPHIDIAGRLIPTSCTRIHFQNHNYLMYGFAGKHSVNSTQIAMVHVVYDDVGSKLDFDKRGYADYFQTHYTPDLVFRSIQTRSGFNINTFIGGYGQSDNPDDIERWQMAKAINEMNSPVRENNRLIDEQLSLITNQNTVLTPEEEQPWIETVEKSVFVAQTILGIN